MRISRGTIDPGSISEEQLTALIGAVADAIKSQPGFLAYQGGVNREAGTLVAVSTWQDADSANSPREALGAFVSKVRVGGNAATLRGDDDDQEGGRRPGRVTDDE